MTQKIAQFLYKVMIIIFIAIMTLTICCSLFDNVANWILVLLGALVGGAVVTFVAHKCKNLVPKNSDIILVIALSVLCFAVKFLWVYFNRVEPLADYATFYYTAVELSENWMIENRYLALFPHIMGYSTFLSLFMKIFGAHVLLGTTLNVVLTVLSGILIYKIVKELISIPAATMAYLFWIICPSQTIYNDLILSEPLYTTFMLGFVYLLVCFKKKEKNLNWISLIVYAVLAGLILQIVNVSRPIAVIFVIALFIGFFVLRVDELVQKDYVLRVATFMVVLVGVYSLTGNAWNACITSRLGEAPASLPGYNIHVGFNTASKGGWNQQDSDLLFSYSNQEGATAEWAQEQMLEEAKERIFSGEINFIELFKDKLTIFLGNDSSCVEYNWQCITRPQIYALICNVFYYCMLGLSVLGGIQLLKQSPKSVAYILPLYVIGLTCAQLLVEVAGRYHYSAIPFFIMIAQFFLFSKREVMPKGEEI